MKWPWNRAVERQEHEVEEYTTPAREEIDKTKERLTRINAILREAHAAQVVVHRYNKRE